MFRHTSHPLRDLLDVGAPPGLFPGAHAATYPLAPGTVADARVVGVLDMPRPQALPHRRPWCVENLSFFSPGPELR